MSLLFVLAGLLAIAGALGLVLATQPVHQVLATVLNFIGLAVLYLSLQAELLAVVQIIVYGGAVMVLFLFVIALLSATKELEMPEQKGLPVQRIAGFSIGGALLLMLALVGLIGGAEQGSEFPAVATEFGEVGNFGWALFTTHVFAFEVLAFILLVAVIGVVILVGRQKS